MEYCRDSSIILVDEVGKLELQEKGWAPFLEPLTTITSAIHIWVVRESLVEKVRRKWNLQQTEVIHIGEHDSFDRLKTICLREHYAPRHLK